MLISQIWNIVHLKNSYRRVKENTPTSRSGILGKYLMLTLPISSSWPALPGGSDLSHGQPDSYCHWRPKMNSLDRICLSVKPLVAYNNISGEKRRVFSLRKLAWSAFWDWGLVVSTWLQSAPPGGSPPLSSCMASTPPPPRATPHIALIPLLISPPETLIPSGPGRTSTWGPDGGSPMWPVDFKKLICSLSLFLTFSCRF